MEERLQKVIAGAGVASRRKAEELIREGRVAVNGVVIKDMGRKVNPNKDKIRVNGRFLPPPPEKRYLLFHKPPGMVTSMRDPEGRADLGKSLQQFGEKERVFPVGRLDYNSSGLLLLTNDGEMANRLLHPRFEISKVYQVKVSGIPGEKTLSVLRQGIKLEDGMATALSVRIMKLLGRKAWLEIEVHEGRNRIVRRMCEAVGHPVEKLKRVRIGPLSLGSLPPGAMRPLLPKEIKELKRAVQL